MSPIEWHQSLGHFLEKVQWDRKPEPGSTSQFTFGSCNGYISSQYSCICGRSLHTYTDFIFKNGIDHLGSPKMCRACANRTLKQVRERG